MEYVHGEVCPQGATLRMHVEARDRFTASFALFGAGRGPAASPAALETLAPVLQGALDALIDRYNSHRQVEALAQILNAADEATLLVDLSGEILFANPKGEEFLALHTEEPLARLSSGAPAEPLLHLIVREMRELAARPETMVRRTLTLASGQTWQLEIVSLSRGSGEGQSLVILSPIQLPTGPQLHARLKRYGVSPREAEVIAHLLRGHRNPGVAEAMGISEYTVKDHLKHLFAKLSVASRTELFARLAAEGAIPPQD
jgi:DNA-binding CsgD family transcriptional regulator